MARPFIPYGAGSFHQSKAQGAPLDNTRTSAFLKFMTTFADQRGTAYPVINGVGKNKWGTVFAQGYSSDPLWTMQGVPQFHAPSWLGQSLTGTSDSPFCVQDMVGGFTVFGTKASASGRTITVQSAGVTYHDSNGLDAKNPKSDDKRNHTSRGRISEGLVIRRDCVQYGIDNNTDLGYVLHFFMAETNSGDGHCHPMTGHESGKSGFGAEGERIVIKPSVDVTKKGLSPAGLVVARTLQNYGAIIGDNAGRMSTLKAEQERGGQVWGTLLTQDSLKGLTWSDFACVQRGWQ